MKGKGQNNTFRREAESTEVAFKVMETVHVCRLM